MRQLNGVYAQHFNRRHKLVGHVLQGRYQAILVPQENYLLELARYIVLNPVRAHMVASPDDRYWSSPHYVLDKAVPPCWLAGVAVENRRAISRLKDFRAVAIRFKKRGHNFLAAVSVATMMLRLQ